MKFDDLSLILLVITFIILSIFYIINVCDYNIKEFFDLELYPRTESKNGIVTNCSTEINVDISNSIQYNSCELEPNSVGCSYTGDKFILNPDRAIKYHSDYSCDNVKGYTGIWKDIDRRNLLLAYSCIGLSPKELQQKFSNDKIDVDTILTDGYFDVIDDSSSDADSLVKKIKDTILTKVRTIPDVSFFPIYVCISQAPLLKYGNEDTVVWDHNRGQPREHDKYSCWNKDMCKSTRKMYIEILIIFFKNDAGNLRKFITMVAQNKSSSLQCNLNCGNSTDRIEGLACGCLNKPQSYDVGKDKETSSGGNYNSVCRTGNTNKNYSIVYFVNTHYNFNMNSETKFKNHVDYI